MNPVEILEQENCPRCGGEIPAPADGRWRWARGGKVHASLEEADVRAYQLTQKSETFEFRAELDARGLPRIASRRIVKHGERAAGRPPSAG